MPTAVVAKRPRLAAAIEREVFTIIARPTFDSTNRRLPGRFDALSDRLLVHGTKTPFLDGARALLNLGFDPNATVVMKHAGYGTECLRARIGVAAKLTVKEPDRGYLHFALWRPFSSSPVKAPFAQNVRNGPRGPVSGEVASSSRGAP